MIVFAGPGVAGAIRNQFNLVGNTLNSGTNGGTEGCGASGGGSTGADSATVQAAIAKDAKDWTLDEQKAVAEDIAAKGEASPAYAKAKAAMDAGTEWSEKLTNRHSMTYKIIGINHDDLADGSGKAGLTFEATNAVMGDDIVNESYTNIGGWEKSRLRYMLNFGYLWSLLPSKLQSKVKPVTKMTDNLGGGKGGTPSTTKEKLFLLSTTEIYGDIQSDRTQYEYYAAKGVTSRDYSVPSACAGSSHWLRSIYPTGLQFCYVAEDYSPRAGDWSFIGATSKMSVCPAWCF